MLPFCGQGFESVDPLCGPTHCLLSHAVVAALIQNRGRLAQILAQGQSSSGQFACDANGIWSHWGTGIDKIDHAWGPRLRCE